MWQMWQTNDNYSGENAEGAVCNEWCAMCDMWRALSPCPVLDQWTCPTCQQQAAIAGRTIENCRGCYELFHGFATTRYGKSPTNCLQVSFYVLKILLTSPSPSPSLQSKAQIPRVKSKKEYENLDSGLSLKWAYQPWNALSVRKDFQVIPGRQWEKEHGVPYP